MASPDCSSCPLFERKKRTLVPSTFAEAPNGLVILGEQPWVEEAKEGRPFVGRSGRLLDAVLARHGIDRAACHVLNAFSCFTGPEIKDADKKKAWIACRPRVLAELAMLKPRVILGLGGTALSSLLGEVAKITDYLGATLPIERAGELDVDSVVTVSYHPAAVLRSTTSCELAVLDAHVAKVARWLAGGYEPWDDDAFVPRPTPERVRALRGTIAIDVETTGKNRFTCGLRTVGLGTWDEALVVPCLPGERDEASWPAMEAAIAAVLSSPFIRKVFHNKQFDIPVLERHFGVPVAPPTDDTMVGHFVLHPLGNVLHGLAPASGMYLDVPAWKKEHEGDFAEEPIDELMLYNSRDVRITYRLHNEIQERIAAEGLEKAYEVQNDNPLLALELARNGIPVDMDAYRASLEHWRSEAQSRYLAAIEASGCIAAQMALYDRMVGSGARRLQDVKLADFKAGRFGRSEVAALQDAAAYGAAVVLDNGDCKALAAHADALAEILDAWATWTAEKDPQGERKGPHAGKLCQKVRTVASAVVKAAQRVPFFNLDSDREVGLVLHERLGLAVMAPTNADGSYATNEEALWHLQGHPLVASWQKWKEAKKQLVWLEGLPIYPDGRIHPSYKTIRIPTSRFASGEGKSGDELERLNAQNIEPRHLELFRPIPGRGFVGADFNSLELRVSAVLSGCKTMLEQFARADAGLDLKLHSQTARIIWPNEPEKKWKEGKLYDAAKRTNFLTIYGGGADTLYGRLRELEEPKATPAEQAQADAELRALCETVISAHKRIYPEIHEAARQWYYDAMRTGYLKVCHVTGHRYRYPIRSKEYIRPTLMANAPIQGTGATIAHIAGRILRQALPSGAFLITYTHDFYLVECDVNQMQEVAELMRSCMRYYLEGPAGGLWVTAAPKLGWSWKQCK